jgi:uncharacterized Zn finger protein (UPF0148 family)
MNPFVQEIAARHASLEQAVRKGVVAGEGALLAGDRYAWAVSKDRLGLASFGALEQGGIDAEEKSALFRISSTDIDSDGDVVLSTGCRLDRYEKNPIVLFGHGEWSLPVGVSRSPRGELCVWPGENEIRAKWFCDTADPDACFLFGKVERGIISAASIAFIPLSAERREPGEKARSRNDAGMLPLGWLFKVWEMTEWTVCPVPSNKSAVVLREALDHEKSHITPRLQKALAPYAAVPRGKAFSGWVPGLATGDKPVEKSADPTALAAWNGFRDLSATKLAEVERAVAGLGRQDLADTLAAMGAPPSGRESAADLRRRILQKIRDRAGAWGRAQVSLTGDTRKFARPKSKLPAPGSPRMSQKDLNETSGAAGGYAVDEGAKGDTPTCQACGKALTPGATECAACGTAVTTKAEDEEVAKDTPPPDEVPDEETPQTPDEDEPVEKDDAPLPSAMALAGMHAQVKEAVDWARDQAKGLEHPQIKEYLGAHADELEGHLAKYKDMLAEHHPGHDMDKLCKMLNGGEGEAAAVDRSEVPDEPAPDPVTEEINERYEEGKGKKTAAKAADSQGRDLKPGDWVTYQERPGKTETAKVTDASRDVIILDTPSGPVNIQASKVTKKGLTGPTRMQIQEAFDKQRQTGMSVREATRKIEEMFNIRNVVINQSGQVASYEQNKAAPAPVAKSLTAKAYGAAGEAAGYMADLAQQPDVPRVHRAGLSHHAGQLAAALKAAPVKTQKATRTFENTSAPPLRVTDLCRQLGVQVDVKDRFRMGPDGNDKLAGRTYTLSGDEAAIGQVAERFFKAVAPTAKGTPAPPELVAAVEAYKTNIFRATGQKL